MNPRLLPLLVLLAAGLSTACDDGEPSLDAALSDAMPADALPADARPDARPDDAAPPDGGPDAAIEPDSGPDATPDAAPDAAPDAQVDAEPDAGPPPHPLRITELMARNDGTWVDEVGEADDWLELQNTGDEPLSLAGHALTDGADPWPLPDVVLEPGAVVLLWADDAPEAGPLHLPFKLSGGGEQVRLLGPDGEVVDAVEFPELADDEAWALIDGLWQRCRHATPDAPNGVRCAPEPPPGLVDEAFAPYDWADPWPAPPTPLIISELALPRAGEGFVEVVNRSEGPVDTAGFDLRLAPHRPGDDWPTAADGAAIPWPAPSIEPGGRLVVPVSADAIEPLAADPLFEGVVQLWAPERQYPSERIDFMSWPEGAVLARYPRPADRHVFCRVATPGEANDACDPLPARPIDPDAGRLRHLRTPGDASALAEGGVEVGVASVKFVLDLEGGGAVHLLSARRWDLHYTFAREVIDGLPRLDRCDPQQSREFTVAWSAWSRINYFQVEGRRYLLGTLAHHAGPDLRTLEFASGDAIDADQMRRAFFGAVGHVLDPQAYFMRPRTAAHLERARTLEGRVPLVGPNAPYRDVTWQPLTQTVGYGVLAFVPAAELESASLGPQTIVVTDEVPNDIALVGGLITEAFQTPLAHVNLLSRNRDTPNMALPGARTHPDVEPLLGELVRLEVAADGWSVDVADPAEAEAFWASRREDGPLLRPRLDTTVRGVVPLSGQDLDALPYIGAKAAQLAELARVWGPPDSACSGPVPVPRAAMAVPMVHGREHFESSGAADRLALRRADPRFDGDPRFRAAALGEVRTLMQARPVDPEILTAVEAYVAEHFPAQRVRFRSSSNTEDLPGFNGAGLYTSVGVDPGESIADALRAVWASLYFERAWAERDYFGIDQDGVAMAVLVHPAFPAERANGVGISRNVLEPIRSQHYFNVQHGEALVTNPAPGVGTEQIIFDRLRRPRVSYLARSTLRHGAPVLSEDEIEEVGCTLRAIHDHFRPLLDPEFDDQWFAMDIEFKHLGADRYLLVKQARPYSFGRAEVPADCRSL